PSPLTSTTRVAWSNPTAIPVGALWVFRFSLGHDCLLPTYGSTVVVKGCAGGLSAAEADQPAPVLSQAFAVSVPTSFCRLVPHGPEVELIPVTARLRRRRSGRPSPSKSPI